MLTDEDYAEAVEDYAEAVEDLQPKRQSKFNASEIHTIVVPSIMQSALARVEFIEQVQTDIHKDWLLLGRPVNGIKSAYLTDARLGEFKLLRTYIWVWDS